MCDILAGVSVFTVAVAKIVPVFRRCRFDIRGERTKPEHVIVALGQVHPVLSGRFERFQAKKIARVQAWVFRVCEWFWREYGIDSFGQEGFGRSAGQAQFEARLPEDFLQELQRHIQTAGSPEVALRTIAYRWRRALRTGNTSEMVYGNSALNGLAVLQAGHDLVTIFPIEQTHVHSGVSGHLQEVSARLEQIEHTADFQNYRRKKGRGLTKAEYDAAVTYRTLVSRFNRTLKAPERDRSIFIEVLAMAKARPLTVFVLGQGHRFAQLQLAKSELPSGYQFIWITPSSLWWWQAISTRIGWVFVVLLAAAFVWWLY